MHIKNSMVTKAAGQEWNITVHILVIVKSLPRANRRIIEMRKADYKVSAKPVRINGFCSICKKETNNGYCYVHPYGHREYLICPNCLMYSDDSIVKEARIELRDGGRKR